MDLTLDPRRSQLLRILRTKERCSGHDIVALTLRELGITHVFGIGGVPVDATLGACARAGLRDQSWRLTVATGSRKPEAKVAAKTSCAQSETRTAELASRENGTGTRQERLFSCGK